MEPEKVRKQKACDAENLSKYNKLAKTGGHKSKSLIFFWISLIVDYFVYHQTPRAKAE